MTETDRHDAGEPLFLTLDAASALLTVSRRMFDKMRKRPGFPRPVMLGRLPRFRRADLVAWADAQAEAANPAFPPS